MLGILESVWDFLQALPDLLLFVLESVLNLIIGVFNGVFIAAVALLPELPAEIGPPVYVEYLNWLFPVGAAATVAVGLLAGYVTFLSIRWVLKKSGALA